MSSESSHRLTGERCSCPASPETCNNKPLAHWTANNNSVKLAFMHACTDTKKKKKMIVSNNFCSQTHFCRFHKHGPHDVGTVRLVADTETADNGAKMESLVGGDSAELELVLTSALNDGAVAYLQLSTPQTGRERERGREGEREGGREGEREKWLWTREKKRQMETFLQPQWTDGKRE